MYRRNLLLGAASLSALSTKPAQSFEREGSRRIMVFSGNQAVTVLDPHARYDWSTRMMQRAVYDALVRYQGDPPTIIPWVAERWETSPDGLQWTFHLAANAKFNNGDPLDAEAVRFSFERALKLNKGIAWMLSAHLDPAAITVVDPHTVRMTLKQPYPDFLSFLPMWFITNPKQVMANQDGDDYGQKWLTSNAAGSGPFTIKRWDGQTVMSLEAAPGYWKGWPMGDEDRPAGVIFRVMREDGARKAALQRGEIDMAAGLPPDDCEQMAKVPGITVTNNPGIAPFSIMLNTQKGATADLNLRKALAYAFDYQALITIHKGAATLLDSPFPKITTDHVTIDMPRQDLARAKDYLGKTKYAEGGLELEYCYVAGNEIERQIGLILLSAVQPLGIKVNLVAQPWATLIGRGASPETAADMSAVYVTPVTTSPDTIVSQYASSAAGQFWGIHHLRDKQIDTMVAAASVELDAAKRSAMYASLQQRIVDLQPAIFCMAANQRWAMRQNVKGFSFCPLMLTGEADFYSLYVAKA